MRSRVISEKKDRSVEPNRRGSWCKVQGPWPNGWINVSKLAATLPHRPAPLPDFAKKTVGTQSEIGSSVFQLPEEADNAVIYSLSQNEIRESAVQQNGLYESPEPQTHGRPVNNTLRCGDCGLLFSNQHLLK